MNEKGPERKSTALTEQEAEAMREQYRAALKSFPELGRMCHSLVAQDAIKAVRAGLGLMPSPFLAQQAIAPVFASTFAIASPLMVTSAIRFAQEFGFLAGIVKRSTGAAERSHQEKGSE
ncbi:MAG TPA: hypothetical protein VGB17_16440 [Pyrinomonadaceae bacterium]|jgi:hypothetical protein